MHVYARAEGSRCASCAAHMAVVDSDVTDGLRRDNGVVCAAACEVVEVHLEEAGVQLGVARRELSLFL